MKVALNLRVANKSQLGLNIQEQRLRKYSEKTATK